MTPTFPRFEVSGHAGGLHQDVYSQFGDPPLGGNGAPAWAVHTDGLPWKPNPEMWELG